MAFILNPVQVCYTLRINDNLSHNCTILTLQFFQTKSKENRNTGATVRKSLTHFLARRTLHYSFLPRPHIRYLHVLILTTVIPIHIYHGTVEVPILTAVF